MKVIFKELFQHSSTGCFSVSFLWQWPASAHSPGSYPGVIWECVQITARSPEEMDNPAVGLLAMVLSSPCILCCRVPHVVLVVWVG